MHLPMTILAFLATMSAVAPLSTGLSLSLNPVPQTLKDISDDLGKLDYYDIPLIDWSGLLKVDLLGVSPSSKRDKAENELASDKHNTGLLGGGLGNGVGTLLDDVTRKVYCSLSYGDLWLMVLM